MATKFRIIEIPTGYEKGLYGGEFDIKSGWLFDSEGLSFHKGIITKEPGQTKLNSTALPGIILSGTEYSPSQSGDPVRTIVLVSDRTLRKDDGTGTFPTTLATGLNPSDFAVFVEGGKEGAALYKKLFIFTGTNQVKVLAGDANTVTNLATPPADWSSNFPTSGFVFEGRLCGFGNQNDPHRLYFSTQTNHENFTGTGSLTISIFPGEGAGLTAAVPIKNGVILFKAPRGIYLLDARDPVSSNWKVHKLSSALGCPSQRCVTSTPAGIVFLDVTGLPYLLRFSDTEGLILKELFDQENFMFDFITYKMDVKNARLWQVFVDKRHNGGEVNIIDGKFRLVVDFATGVPRFRKSKAFNISCAWETYFTSNKEYSVAYGDKDGFVWLAKKDVFGHGGSIIPFRFRTTSAFVEGTGEELGRRKLGGELEVFYTSTNKNASFVVKVYEDGYEVLRKTISRVISVAIKYDEGYTYDGLNATYGSGFGRLFSDKIRIPGSWKRISVEVNEESLSDFGVHKILLYTLAGDERVASEK